MKKTRQLTFCAIMSALSIVILYLGALLNVFDLCTVLIASVFLYVVAEELGNKWGFGTYIVTAALCAAIMFSINMFIFFEYLIYAIYPMLKRIFDRLKLPLSIVLKATYIALASFLTVLVEKVIIKAPKEAWFIEVAFVALTVAALILYDIAFKRFGLMYHNRLRYKLRIDRFFK